ncbi:glycosyltransferase [Candidatus Nomurabacteria bacterium]|nr:glycosyltransferase [Candidatus Nomurabacteria bacterium]
MKLLIVTQVVDESDSILGFFHRWIEEFSKHYEKVTVICLKKGEYHLPVNVEVLTLGKEDGASRSKYLWRFYKYIWSERNNYDTVFVHMNQEYVLLGGLFWRFWGKRVHLWYTHKMVSVKLRLATLLSDKVFTASEESFRFDTPKLRIAGHGIDTDFFSPDSSVVRSDHVLSVGRLMKSKRHDLIIRAVAFAGKELRIIGDGPERKNLEALAHMIGARVYFLGGLNQSQVRDQYQKAAFFVHTSETGSLDKVTLEALACGLSVVTTSDAYRNFPVRKVQATPEAIAAGLETTQDGSENAKFVREHHNLRRLIVYLSREMSVLGPRVAFIFTRSRKEIIRGVQTGQCADTPLYGMNHIPHADYFTLASKSMRAVFIILHLFRYDFVIAQDNLLLGYIVSICSRTFNLKTRWLYVAINSSTLMRRHAKHPIRLFILKKFWSSYSHIICLSFDQLNDFIQIGLPQAQLSFIPFGVDATFFQPTDIHHDENLIVSVGRDGGRDYRTLFYVAGLVGHRFVVVAGQKNIPHDVSIPPNMSIVYDRSIVEVRDLYTRARLIVVVSKDARIPDGSDCSGQTVILDALAAGKTVVATHRSWIADYFVPGRDLIVVEPGNSEAVATAITTLWNDAERRGELSASGRNKVSMCYTTKIFATALLKLMESIK